MSSHSSVVTRKGQITIPADLRRSLDIQQGDRVIFIQDEKGLILLPTSSIARTTAGMLRDGRGPIRTREEERAAFERGIAEENAIAPE